MIVSCHTTENNEKYNADGNTSDSWCIWNSPQRPGNETGGTGAQRKNRDYPDQSIDKIDKNTQKSPGDRRRQALSDRKSSKVSRTPEKDYFL